MNICKICNKEYKYDRNKGHREEVCGPCYITRYRRRLKKKCVEYKGGKCQECGYNKCNSALTFHHIDPNEKDFGISANGLLRS